MKSYDIDLSAWSVDPTHDGVKDDVFVSMPGGMHFDGFTVRQSKVLLSVMRVPGRPSVTHGNLQKDERRHIIAVRSI